MKLIYTFFTLPGPQFLIGYVALLFVTFCVVYYCRLARLDNPWLTTGALILFEGTGIVRIYIGLGQDMHRWNYHLLLMVVGFVLLTFRPRFSSHRGGKQNGGSSGESNSSTSGCSSGSGCSGGVSSCGGGGSSSSSGGGCGSSCGGGGCGGCGGGGGD
ncbi:MAG TPA: hypothetical protein VK970_14115 [Candidatus Methylacidiphilales bacterium]|nr:hypothetical protein [Candidatus Methylacidiphilales bacterium]